MIAKRMGKGHHFHLTDDKIVIRCLAEYHLVMSTDHNILFVLLYTSIISYINIHTHN